ncbi:MAG TPA: hypothetical protein PKY30_21490 [Myxococcota bacterium]|nr:hypothetical protein [Myxococcota bacterium]
MLNFILAFLLACAQPTEFDYCVDFEAAACACDPEECGAQGCEVLDVATVCDPQNSGFSAQKCEAAHAYAAYLPWECLGTLQDACDLEERLSCYPEDQQQ